MENKRKKQCKTKATKVKKRNEKGKYECLCERGK